MGNEEEEVVKLIQEYHETRIENLEGHVTTLNREMGLIIGKVDGLCKLVKGVDDTNKFWLKVIGVGTPGTIVVLWGLSQIIEYAGR